MANKSLFRITIERAFTDACVNVTREHVCVFVDNRKDGTKRIKFSFVHLNSKQTSDVRRNLRKEFPDQDIRIEDLAKSNKGPWFGYHGTAVHLYK